MEVALEQAKADCPLNLQVESVLPGVHSRMTVQENRLSTIEGTMGSVERRLVALQSHMLTVKACVEEIRSRDARVSEALGNVSEAMRPRPQQIEEGRLNLQGSDADENERQAQQQQDQQETTPKTKYCLRPKHLSLETLVAEWFGLGEFEGKPIPGGVEEMEKKNKSKWRKHFSSSQKRSFARTKDIMEGMKRRMETEEATEILDIVNEWDEIYRGECKCSTYYMSELGNNNGFLESKKPRGKSARTT